MAPALSFLATCSQLATHFCCSHWKVRFKQWLRSTGSVTACHVQFFHCVIAERCLIVLPFSHAGVKKANSLFLFPIHSTSYTFSPLWLRSTASDTLYSFYNPSCLKSRERERRCFVGLNTIINSVSKSWEKFQWKLNSSHVCSLIISVLRSSEIIFAAIQSHTQQQQMLSLYSWASFASPGDTVWKHPEKTEHRTIILHLPSKYWWSNVNLLPLLIPLWIY